MTAGEVTVRKLDHTGREVISYPGEVIERSAGRIVVRTSWDRGPLDLGFVLLEPEDRWTETFYADRWYNIFEICDSEGNLKGWYCNITRPARIAKNEIVAEDLALDLWVGSAGDTRVLDEDEFKELDMRTEERIQARAALADLYERLERRLPPFDRQSSSV